MGPHDKKHEANSTDDHAATGIADGKILKSLSQNVVWGDPTPDTSVVARVASTANVTVAAPGASIDGVTLSVGDRVLLKNQSTTSQNGLYIFNGAASPMTRTTDTIVDSLSVWIGEGTVNKGTAFVQTTNNPITIGVSSIVFDKSFPTAISKTIFVDAAVGLLQTPEPYNINRPYSTITAAQAVAVAGDTIWIWPGTYNESGLGINGVRYHFVKGANITSTGVGGIFDDLGVVKSFEVSGNGVFTSTNSVLLLRTTSTMKVECDGLATTGGVCIESRTYLALGFGGGNFTVKVNGDITTASTRAIYLWNTSATTITQNVLIEANNIFSSQGVEINKTSLLSTLNCTLKVSDVIQSTTSSAIETVKFLNLDTNDFLRFNCKCYATLVRKVLSANLRQPAVKGQFTLYSDIEQQCNAPVFGFSTFGTANVNCLDRLIHYGNATSVGQIMYMNHSSTAYFELYGNYIAGITGTLTRSAIEVSGSLTQKITIQGKVQNASVGVGRDGIYKFQNIGPSADFILNLLGSTRIVTDVAAKSLTTDGLTPTYNVFPSVTANTVIGAGVVEQISLVVPDVNVN